MTDSTTVKALRVIEALAASEEPRGVAELGRALGLTKSNTFRILSTLVEQGYVRAQGESGRYALTLRVWEYGVKVIDRHPTRRVALPHMRMLFGKVKETILLAALESTDVLYIGKVDSDNPIRASARVGQRAPSWKTASGLSMLSFQPESVLQDIMGSAVFAGSSESELREKVAEVRSRGYAISVNGTRVGVSSIAAPIWNGEAAPRAAISVSGPAERFTPERMAEVGILVLNSATQVSESLG